MSNIARPFIPWVGGKEKLVPYVRQVFPDNVSQYLEPFGGGGAVLTEEGAQLLARYDELCRRMQAYGRRQFEELFGEE